MPLHPEAKALLDQRVAMGVRSAHELSVDAARAQAVRVSLAMGAGEAVASCEDLAIPSPHGAIPVRVFTPGAEAPRPVLVYFHGGGWVLGDLDAGHQFCRAIANAVGCTVISVNYRHAPEHRFPAAAEDCYAAVAWVAREGRALGVETTRLAVGGHSAGGNLAAVVAQMARDRDAPSIAFQLLIVPVIDHHFETVSYREHAEGYGLTADAMRWFWSQYLGAPEDGRNPYASPLRAASLRGLPPAFVATAEYDPLRDEGDAYAARLRQDDVPTIHVRYAGMIHAFLGGNAIGDMANALRSALAR